MVVKYTIDEALSILNIGRTSLYHRMKKFEKVLNDRGHLTLDAGKKYIDEEGIDILRNNDSKLLETVQQTSKHDENHVEYSELKKEMNNLETLIKSKDIEIEHLRKEGEHLRSEIEYLRTESLNKDFALNKSQESLHQQQLIFNLEQQKQIKLLDTKNESFFSKIFKRKSENSINL